MKTKIQNGRTTKVYLLRKKYGSKRALVKTYGKKKLN